MGNRENECQFSQNYIFYMDFSEIYLGFHNSCEIWHSFSRTPMRNFLWCYFRWLITSLVLQKCKTENAIFFKLFWCKVFVPLELKLLHFLVDSAVNVLWSDIKLNCSLKKRPTFYVYLLRIPTFEIWTDILLLFVCLFVFFFVDRLLSKSVSFSASEIANHDVFSGLHRRLSQLACLGFSCSNFAKKNKRLLAVYFVDILGGYCYFSLLFFVLFSYCIFL